MTPRLKRGPQVAEALQREEVGPERDHHVVRGDERSPIDGAEVRSQVDQHHVRIVQLGAALDHPREGGDDPKGALITVHALRPDLGQVVLELGKRHVPGNQRQAVGPLLESGSRMSPTPRLMGSTAP